MARPSQGSLPIARPRHRHDGAAARERQPLLCSKPGTGERPEARREVSASAAAPMRSSGGYAPSALSIATAEPRA